MYKKERRKYYEKLDLNKVTDNKEFWIKFFQNIFDINVANLFSNFFENAVNSLDIKKKEPCGKIYCLSDPAETVI